ncbi:MAG: hypothetical protein JSS69_05965 [Acidobacteria bacterium]|nr:hypothetical protein [Acidobacteriota bacterium]MBS1865447.1 hypothetical protein [Acidobacteriota bacterium]
MAATDIRPMSLGEVLDRTFSLYKNNFLLLTGILAVPMLIKFVFAVGIEWYQRASLAGVAARPGARSQFFVGVILASIGAGLIDFVLRSASQGGTIIAVSEIYLGRKPTVAGSYRPVMQKLWSLIGLILLTALMCGAGFVFLIIPGILLLVKTAMTTNVLMLEDETVGGSISRSWDLTKEFGLQIFLIFVLVFVIGMVVSAVLVTPITVAIGIMKLKTVPMWMAVLQHLATFLAEVLVGPIGTIAMCLMYYNLRVRKEAFDLQHLMTSLELPANPASNAPSVA